MTITVLMELLLTGFYPFSTGLKQHVFNAFSLLAPFTVILWLCFEEVTNPHSFCLHVNHEAESII